MTTGPYAGWSALLSRCQLTSLQWVDINLLRKNLRFIKKKRTYFVHILYLFIGWLIKCLVYWLAELLAYWLVGLLTYLFTSQLVSW